MSRFSKRQLAALRGIVDGLLPSMAPPEASLKGAKNYQERERIQAYYEHLLSSNQYYMEALETSIFDKIAGQESMLLRILLVVLSTVPGTMLLFGTLRPLWTFQSFAESSTADQTALLQSLKGSGFQEKRKTFNGLKRLICGLAYSFAPDDDTGAGNPFWPAIGYPGPPQRNLSKREDEARMAQGAKTDFRTIPGVMLDVQGDMELDFDVVVVGSGCGGGVAAATLAKAGYSVIVLEKGPYLSPSEITNLETDALDRMFQSHGFLTTSDGNFMILAASTLGGGSIVNWSCCLETPKHVRQEWIEKHGLVQFGAGYDEHLLAVRQRIGCDDKSGITHNTLNQHLIDSCETMGYEWEVTGQNLRNGSDDSTGFICFGDRYGNKNDGLATYLKDAIDHGAKIIDNCSVDKVLMEPMKSSSRGKRATGVESRVGQHRVKVNAKRCVIVAAGALNTPCVLLRSGLRNKHIGRHLHLHPATAVAGIFDKDVDINCYLKAPLTTVCDEFQMGPRNDGYGPKIECPSAHTGLLAAGLPYSTPEAYKMMMLRLRHAAPFILVLRDSSEGRVRLGADGFGPRIDYVFNEADKESMLHSLKGAVKMLAASGANLIMTSHCHDSTLALADTVPRTKESLETNAQIHDYLESITKRGMKEHEMSVFVAHQMGSCRMSISADGGVVDELGEAWECNDLFLVDTSVFPTASGANPMLTTLAISHMLSTRLVARLKQNDSDSSNQKKDQ
jgi:choline dehydrogenase-like flavoprotein